MDFICIFAGQVTIEFHVEKETNFIVLHIQDLNITEKVILFRSKARMQTYGLASMQAPARTFGHFGMAPAEIVRNKYDSWLSKWDYWNLIKNKLSMRQLYFELKT